MALRKFIIERISEVLAPSSANRLRGAAPNRMGTTPLGSDIQLGRILSSPTTDVSCVLPRGEMRRSSVSNAEMSGFPATKSPRSAR